LRAGFVTISSGQGRAILWTGSAASAFDLHQFAPAEFANSQAYGITTDGTKTYVTGFGFNLTTGRTEALLWTGPLPCCPSDFNCDGFTTGDDFDSYVTLFEMGTLAADFNRDGFVTGDDFDGYVAAFETGC